MIDHENLANSNHYSGIQVSHGYKILMQMSTDVTETQMNLHTNGKAKTIYPAAYNYNRDIDEKHVI